MRLLMLASEYPPAKVFGLGRAVQDLSRALVSAGDEVHVLTNSLGAEEQDTIKDGVQVHRINYPSPPQPPDSTACVVQFNLCLLERAAQLLPTLGPIDVLHAHDWLVALAADRLQARLSVPLVTTIHDTAVGKYFGRLDRHQQYVAFCERWLVARSARTIICSEYVKQELIESYGGEPERLAVIPCGVDPAPFRVEFKAEAFRAVFSRPEEKLLLYVGRLDPEKGLQVLFPAFDRLAARRPELRLVVVGEGRLRDTLPELLSGLQRPEQITFLGYVAHPALAALYRSAAVVVVPSLYEPFGLVALEAMTAGRPVVVSAVGGLAEIVTDGETGLCFPPGDEAALTEALERVLAAPELARQLAEAGRERAAQAYSWEGIARKTRDCYLAAGSGDDRGR